MWSDRSDEEELPPEESRGNPRFLAIVIAAAVCLLALAVTLALKTRW
jgi:hypothetical protein